MNDRSWEVISGAPTAAMRAPCCRAESGPLADNRVLVSGAVESGRAIETSALKEDRKHIKSEPSGCT